ncbi:unnamed protein product [Tuber melanosporum]|uniref:Alpha-1,3-glucosyltransferase n=1 Tax=Tuber melanosporum (strain Mel28) TaxID=656061 RepID=D5GJY1_TUBMM|nr:uncharacterized protein GSTUM_00009264001 [Tuber melanosporum]CAZ84824.1 unnamed protein product [Tuber melanosporum]
MDKFHPSLRECAIAATAFKLLLFPAYKSTDFEVHRNWLAITHSLPVKEWYYEKTSEWTLDYPPFFAVFEWILGQVARFFDPAMLDVRNLGYDSVQTVYFQRSSVMFTELLLLYALQKHLPLCPLKFDPESSKRPAHAVALSIFLSPGFLIVDHIHFQYNGFLYGVLILSITLARSPSTRLYSGFLFALGVGIVGIIAAAFGPFLYWGQIPQLLSRLFPFSRGLCHAYWAPNIWAIYSFIDRVLIIVAPRLDLPINQEALTSVTRGLVGDTTFAVLPEITPRTTFLLTLFFQILSLIKLWTNPTYETFLGAITLCGYASFLFGWHVHEKAILLVVIPFSLLALKDRRYLGAFRPLAVAGHVSLFPLLFTAPEFLIKTVYTISWLVVFLTAFDALVSPVAVNTRRFLLDRFTMVFIIVAIPLIAYTSLAHKVLFGDRYEFLPLMFNSSYSAVGVVGSWVGFCWLFFSA